MFSDKKLVSVKWCWKKKYGFTTARIFLRFNAWLNIKIRPTKIPTIKNDKYLYFPSLSKDLKYSEKKK